MKVKFKSDKITCMLNEVQLDPDCGLGLMWLKGKKKLHNHESSMLCDDADNLLVKLCTESESDPGENQSLHMLAWSAHLIFRFYFWLYWSQDTWTNVKNIEVNVKEIWNPSLALS